MIVINKWQRRTRRACGGLAALEVVIATAITLPALVVVMYIGIRICRLYFSVLGSMVGSPYM
jgi:hypothetical protein